MGAYSVSNDPREKLKKKMEQDRLQAASAGQGQAKPDGFMDYGSVKPMSWGAKPAAASPTERPWIPVLGPDSAASAPATPTPEQRDKFALNARVAAGATAPQMGPPTPDVAMRDRLQAIGVRDAILAKQTVRERYLHGKSPEFEGLRDQRFALGDEKYALDNAMRPVAQPQTPAQVSGGREELFGKGLGLADQKMREGIARLQANPNDADARRMVAESERMNQAFRSNLSPYPKGPEDPGVSAVIDRQREAIPAQEANRNAWGERAGTMGGMNVAGEQFQREALMNRAAMARAKMGTELAGARTEEAVAQAGLDPDTIKSRVAALRAKAEMESVQARVGQVKAESGLAASQAVAGGETALAPMADPRLSAAVDAFKAAESGGVGWGDTESVAKMDAAVRGIISHVRTLPPEQAAAVKSQLRSTLSLGGMSIGNFFGPPTRLAAGLRRQASVRELRDFLSQ